MNFDTIFFIVVGIVVAVVIIVILLVVWNNFNKQEELLKSELEQYKKEYVDNIPDIALRVMGSNLLELKEYYIMTKRQYTRTFIITTFFSSIGCAIILGGIIWSDYWGF